MNATAALPIVGVDLAKSVFQLAVADSSWRILESHRLTRTQFERWFVNRAIGLVVMEACGSAHHWARWLNGLGIEVRLLPAAYVRAYVKRNKTDAADACALLEAARCAEIVPVRIKSVDRLEACGVDTVAMESTGVYWIPLYELLDARRFTVLLVNVRHVKNVSGRKSDVLDCQWLQQLMSYGLLRGAFRPADEVCALRALSRQREMLLRSQARHVQHMQKALTQMNIQLTNVISDVVGETGQKILRAIVAGERDGQALAAMKNVRIRASVAEIANSLQGNWRAEHLFALRQALALFDFYGTQLTECDREIEQQLQRLHVHDGEPAKGKQRGRARNAPKFDLRKHLFKMCGVDLTRIDGIDVTTALAVISGIGADMSKFPSVKHFTSWLDLCPGTKITGGKLLSGKTKRCANRAAQALRLAAAALRSSKSALGAYFRRLCSRMDKPKAVTAAAHKLARLIYTMLTKGAEYTDQGQHHYEERYRERVLRHLSQRAAKLGMKMVAIEQPA